MSEKASWYQALQGFQKMVPHEVQRFYLGKHIDLMKLSKTEVDRRFRRIWAKSADPDASFEDVLAVYALEDLEHRVGVDGCTQELYDETIAAIIHDLITVAFNNSEPTHVH